MNKLVKYATGVDSATKSATRQVCLLLFFLKSKNLMSAKGLLS